MQINLKRKLVAGAFLAFMLTVLAFGQTFQEIRCQKGYAINIWFPVSGDTLGWRSSYFLVGEKLYDGNDLTMNLGMQCFEELLNKGKPLRIKIEKPDPIFQLDSIFRLNSQYTAVKLINKTIFVRVVEADIEYITPDCTPPSAGILDFLLTKPSGIIVLNLNMKTLKISNKIPEWLLSQIEANKEKVEKSIATCNSSGMDFKLIKRP